MTNEEAYEILTSDYFIAFDGKWMGDERCKEAAEAIKKGAKALSIVMDMLEMLEEEEEEDDD